MRKIALLTAAFSLFTLASANAEVVAVRRATITPMIDVTGESQGPQSVAAVGAPMPLLIHGDATEAVRPSTVLLIGVLGSGPQTAQADDEGERVVTPPSATASGTAQNGVVRAR